MEPNVYPEERHYEFSQKIREMALTQLVTMKMARENAIKEGKGEDGAQRDPTWGPFHDSLGNSLNRSLNHTLNGRLLRSAEDRIKGLTSLFQALGTISALGASFIFTVLFSNI